MQLSPTHPQPEGLAFVRTGTRAARTLAFALETWSRLTVSAGATTLERARELSWICENLCALHGVRPLVRGAIPREPCILVSNHLSYFDPLILASFVPLTAVAKREVASWPVVGEVARKLGVLFVDREDPASGARVLREALTLLRQGVSVLVFPEGTTTVGDSVLPFKRGIFGAAALASVPVVPVALQYERTEAAWVGDDAFFPHYARSITHACTRVSVRFSEPLWAHQVESAEDFAALARYAVARGLADSAFGPEDSVFGKFQLASA